MKSWMPATYRTARRAQRNASMSAKTIFVARISRTSRGDNTGVGNGGNYQGGNTPLNSTHVGGVHVLMGDGGVRFISDSLGLDIVARLATRDDGQVLGEF